MNYEWRRNMELRLKGMEQEQRRGYLSLYALALGAPLQDLRSAVRAYHEERSLWRELLEIVSDTAVPVSVRTMRDAVLDREREGPCTLATLSQYW